MYRYSVDNAVTYTSEDFVLFRESPFACWMERLTLENPEHGIPPDIGSAEPRNSMERQDDIAETLREEGKNVRLIDWDTDEPIRRTATLDAMREGADFIVNGQLALGPLSGSANLLMRTSGYSELGDFLYIPCDTQALTTLHSTFRLCFLADLLHSLQGQLPPQMLVIRSGDDLLPLQTEDHIYHYRAVKHLFMAAMRDFRKHRMPDPAESSHFGRWSDCAHEVLKQRVLREEAQALQEALEPPEPVEEPAAVAPQQLPEAQREEQQEAQQKQAAEQAVYDMPADMPAMPMQQAVGSSARRTSAYDLDDAARPVAPGGAASRAASSRGLAEVGRGGLGAISAGNGPKGPTLAEQARMLAPGTYTPGPGTSRFPPLAREAANTPSAPSPLHNRRASDAALQNLEFVGSSSQPPLIGVQAKTAPELSPVASTAPSPSLRDPRVGNSMPGDSPAAGAPDPFLAYPPSPAEPVPDESRSRPPVQAGPVAEDSASMTAVVRSVVDMDNSRPVSPPLALSTADAEFSFDGTGDINQTRAELERFSEQNWPAEHRPEPHSPEDQKIALPPRIFSDSLITSDEFDV